MELLGDETDVVPLYYHIVDNFQIQFGREEFCFVTRLRFRVEYWADYNSEDDPIPFRRWVFSSAKDCILQFLLLGFEDRRWVPDSILWDANVRRWPSLYATEPRRDVDKKTYSIFRFTWAFNTWILESFRVGANDYYKRHMRYPRIVAWSSKRKFYRQMIRGFFHEQKRVVDQMMKKEVEREQMYEQVRKFMQDMKVGPVRQANTGPIIVGQHYGIRDFYEFQKCIESIKEGVRSRMYRRTPYMDLPPTTVLTNKRGDKTKNKVKNANVSPLNLGNTFADDNVGGDNIMFLGEHDSSNYLVYKNVDPSKSQPGTAQPRGLVVQRSHECMD
nr:phospholipase-like protein [Tanacetum cinerariifolium]